MPLPFHRRRLDPDAADFCRRSGATDRAAINAFVRGVKALGLWDNMVCWPLRSAQNAGSGNTVYSLGGLGTYDGTRVNEPAWGVDGITKANANEQINVTGTDATLRGALSVFACFKSSATADSQRPFNCQGGNANNNYWQLNNGTDAAKQAYLFTTRNSINANGTLFDTTGRETVFNYWGGAMASTSQQGFFNGTAAAEQTGLAARNATGTPNVDMLGTNGATNARGTLSFAVALTPTLTAAQMTSLYALYKSTLGTGLGLPDYDPATIEYANRSGATDLANIDAFVRGVKDLGLWDNMVCWPLRSSQNKGTGTTAHSLGGLGTYNGTLTNGPSWNADGVAFDGSNDFINIGDAEDLRVGDNDFTVVAWVNPDVVNGNQQGIVAKESGGGSTGEREFMLVIHGSNTFRFYVRPGTTGDFNVAGPTAVAGQNQFVVAWHDSANDNINIQVDNGSVASLAYSQGVFASTNPLQIGAQGNSTFWDGSIAFAATFRKVLTASEKTFLYNAGVPLI